MKLGFSRIVQFCFNYLLTERDPGWGKHPRLESGPLLTLAVFMTAMLRYSGCVRHFLTKIVEDPSRVAGLLALWIVEQFSGLLGYAFKTWLLEQKEKRGEWGRNENVADLDDLPTYLRSVHMLAVAQVIISVLGLSMGEDFPHSFLRQLFPDKSIHKGEVEHYPKSF